MIARILTARPAGVRKRVILAVVLGGAAAVRFLYPESAALVDAIVGVLGVP